MWINLIIGLLGIVGIILSYFLGVRQEKRRQSLIVRSQMLIPIEDWLTKAEELIGILSDTIVSISQGLPLPVMYDLEERKEVYKYLSQHYNKTLGILCSDSLKTKETAKYSEELDLLIRYIEERIRNQVLPLESQIVEASNLNHPTNIHILEGFSIKQDMDKRFMKAHEIIARIRTSLT